MLSNQIPRNSTKFQAIKRNSWNFASEECLQDEIRRISHAVNVLCVSNSTKFHEIRNPISEIRGNSQSLKRNSWNFASEECPGRRAHYGALSSASSSHSNQENGRASPSLIPMWHISLISSCDPDNETTWQEYSHSNQSSSLEPQKHTLIKSYPHTK